MPPAPLDGSSSAAHQEKQSQDKCAPCHSPAAARLNELAAHLRLVEIEAPRARGTNVDGEATVAGALGDVLDIELAPVPAAVGEETAL